jgi:hypothetical protein
MSKTLKELYQEWALMVVPVGASPNQQVDMKRAFYSGYLSCLAAMSQAASDPNKEEAADRIKAMMDEVLAFFQELVEQAAAEAAKKEG